MSQVLTVVLKLGICHRAVVVGHVLSYPHSHIGFFLNTAPHLHMPGALHILSQYYIAAYINYLTS